MAEAKKRVMPIRFDAATISDIERLAGDETEGNLSQMVRRLVREALAARAVMRADDRSESA